MAAPHWTQTLFVNEDTGVTDIAIDPQSPNILYAAAYQRRRTVFGYNGGGPGSGTLSLHRRRRALDQARRQPASAADFPPATWAAAPSTSTARTPTSSTR